MNNKKMEAFLEKFTLDKEQKKRLNEIYETEMLNYLGMLFSKKNWSVEDFLILVLGCRFWPLLMNMKRENKNLEIEKCLQLAKEEILKVYYEKLKFILASENKAEIQSKPNPVRWLELSINYELELDLKIQQRILIAHFGLDWQKAENGLDRGLTCDAHQASEFISKRLGWAVSEKNVLEFCVEQHQYGFNAYLDYKKYCHDRTEFRPLFSPEDIQEAINSGIVSRSHLYNYDGLICLVKENKQDIFSDFLSGQTVKHIRDGGTIEININSPILNVQRSLSDLILGKSQFISVQRQPELFPINSQDLIFRREELTMFCEHYKNDERNLGQLLSRSAIREIYSDLTKDQWNKYFAKEIENGLVKAKVVGRNVREDRYIQNILHQWLIENALYPPKDLAKLTKDTESVTRVSAFDNLLR